MRPKKVRWVRNKLKEGCFKPLCKPLSRLESVYLTLDELEALRLSSLEGLKQINAAKKMKVSRPTFSRIRASACRKITDALVNIKAIRVEGGCCKIIRRK